MKQLFIIISFLFALNSISQERITDYKGDGTNSIFYTTVYAGKTFLLRVTMCDEIEVFEIVSKERLLYKHSIYIDDVFRSEHSFVEFANEYFCFSVAEGLVTYNFLDNTYSVLSIPSPWTYSFPSDHQGNTLLLNLRTKDQMRSNRAVYDIDGNLTILSEESIYTYFKEDHFVEVIRNQGYLNYYLLNYKTGIRDTLVLNSPKQIFFHWEDNGTLFYLDNKFYLNSIEKHAKARISYEKIGAQSSSAKISINEGKVLIGDNNRIKLFDLSSEELILSEEFETIRFDDVYYFELLDKVVVGHMRYEGKYFYNLVSHNTIHVDNISRQYDEHYHLGTNKTLLLNEDGGFSVVDHDNLKIEKLVGNGLNNYSYQNELISIDSVLLLTQIYGGHNRGINQIIELDTLNMQYQIHEAFNNTNNGLAIESLLRKIEDTGLIYTEQDHQQFYSFTGTEASALNKNLDRYWFQDNRLYFNTTDKPAILYAYNGEAKVSFDFTEFMVNNSQFKLYRFSDYSSSILLPFGELYVADKTDGTVSSLPQFDYKSDLYRHNKWTYFKSKNGSLHRVDSTLNAELITELDLAHDLDFRSEIYYIPYHDRLLIAKESVLLEVKANGVLDTLFQLQLEFDKPYSGSTTLKDNHLFIETLEGYLHFDGKTTTERFYFSPHYFSSFVRERDSLYLFEKQEVIAMPDFPVSLLGEFSFAGKNYFLGVTAFSPVGKLLIYETDEKFQQFSLVAEFENTGLYSTHFKILEVGDDALIFAAGLILTVDATCTFKQMDELYAATEEVIVVEEEVYFLAMGKVYGHQLYKWNPEFGSEVVELTPSSKSVNLAPNPTTGLVTLYHDNINSWTLYNCEMSKVQGGNKPMLDLSEYTAGLFYLLIDTNQGIQVERIIKID